MNYMKRQLNVCHMLLYNNIIKSWDIHIRNKKYGTQNLPKR